MAIRRAAPVTWKPTGVSDAADGTNAPKGAMAALTNLIPDPTTPGMWVCRPAAEFLNGLASFTNPTNITATLVVGDIEYGMASTSRNVGRDEPYAYNLSTGAFETISGISAANTPLSPVGGQSPPIMAQVGSRIIVCHPGFDGDGTKFGWFDLSGASISTAGDTISGKPLIVGYPNIFGVQPGLLVTGANIPAAAKTVSTAGPLTNGTVIVGTTVQGSPYLTPISTYGAFMVAGAPAYSSAFPAGTTSAQAGFGGTIQLSQNATKTGTFVVIFDVGSAQPITNTGATHTNTTLDSIVYGTSGMFVGMPIVGAGIPVGTVVSAITGANSLTLSQAATASATISFNVTGNYIVLDQNATGSANGTTITITGGTQTAPLWSAGDTDRNGLPAQPLGVAQMAGRAYFVCGTAGVAFSDSGFPCIRSDTTAVQALTTNDGLSCTAIGPLMLSAPLTGGVVQGLIVFEGATKMQQITGDLATSNLSMNALPVATGTNSPLSIAPCEKGLAFVAPDGLRIVSFNGSVTQPIGYDGSGVTAPFLNTGNALGICAAANNGIIRISAQNSGGVSQEWWYDLRRSIWSGPHTLPAKLIQPWRSTFVSVPLGLGAQIWKTDPVVSASSSFVENGASLTWISTTALLPDNNMMAMNAVIQTTYMLAAGSGVPVSVAAYDEQGNVLDATALSPQPLPAEINVPWHRPIEFKQMKITLQGVSDATIRVGNVYLQYQILGYTIAPPVTGDNLLTADDFVTGLSSDGGLSLLAA